MLERLGLNKKGKTIDELMVEKYDHKDVNEYDLDHGH
jgi:HAE1 family hydrophobic/amphiphilic exporter-1